MKICQRKKVLSIKIFLLIAMMMNPLFSGIYPIQFSIPEEKIISEIPLKDQDFAHCIPGNIETYIFREESEYYHSYQRAYYGLTTKKAGWDCLRHYEILANGCIPYFVDLESCPENVCFLLPKELILKAMRLPGVSYLHIDHSLFDKEQYYEILKELMEYTREHLTSRNIAQYVLNRVGFSGNGSILFLNGCVREDYLRCLTFIGLRQILGSHVIDVPRINHLYQDYTDWNLYGLGMSYSHILDNIEVDRHAIEERICNKEFELIIYGNVHRGLPYLDLVKSLYPPEKIVYLDGDDSHECHVKHTIPNESHFFLREFPN